jgi:hypothetical protein
MNGSAGPFIGQKYRFNRPWLLFFASGGRKNRQSNMKKHVQQ